MKTLSRLMLLVALATTLLVASASAQQSEAPLTNAAVVKLVRAGFKEKTVIAIIRSRPNRFQLDPERLIDLKRSGVSENVILTMLSLHDASFDDDGERWADDAFFRDKAKSSPNNGNGAPGNETDIFGSGGSSDSETKGRGFKGGGSENTTTTGSATVRIIRPPAEAGGSSLKLEKTPTLTNESIVQLVEAGFSEGTIIKRIENSPANFDLSPAKVEDLRKRRVSDPIIAAMTAAMDEADPRSTPGNEK